MVLKSWWMLLVWLGVGVTVLVLGRIVKSRHSMAAKKAATQAATQASGAKKSARSLSVPIAHRERLTSLPGYPKLLRRYRWWVRGVVVCLAVGGLAAIALTARPAAIEIEHPDLRNRDITLCLDVSGSMFDADRQLVQTFAKLAKGFNGERLALSIFDSSSSTIFPLTDDYDFIQSRLSTVAKQLNLDDTDFSDPDSIFRGTYEGNGSSLVGDGLASCVMQFDSLDTKRSRSIIFATDNYAAGEQIVDIKQAGAFAKDKGVRVYGLNPSDYATATMKDEVSAEFKEVVLSTDGAYYKLDYKNSGDEQAVADIVSKIDQQEATRFKGSPIAVQADVPLAGMLLLALGFLGYCVIAWRLRI